VLDGACYLPISDTYTSGSAGCPNVPSVTLAPTVPTVNVISNMAYCEGSSVNINFTGTATTYLWQNSNPSIGLAASGSGNLDFSAADVSDVQIASITVTPDNGICTGTPITFNIIVHPNLDASFSFDDFCVNGTNLPYNIATPGGTFSLSPIVVGGATMDIFTGQLYNGTVGVTYTIKYKLNNFCNDSFLVTALALPPDLGTFIFNDYCEGDANMPTVTGLAGGSFSIIPAPTDGATIDATSGTMSGGVGGTTYSVAYTTIGQCPVTVQESVLVNEPFSPVLPDYGQICKNDGEVVLPNNIGNIDGTWNLDGFETSSFFPPFLDLGNHTLEFVPADYECASNQTTNFEVIEPPTGSLSLMDTVMCPDCNRFLELNWMISGDAGMFDLEFEITNGPLIYKFQINDVANNGVLYMCGIEPPSFYSFMDNLHIFRLPAAWPPGTYTIKLTKVIPNGGTCSVGAVVTQNISFLYTAPTADENVTIVLCDNDLDGETIDLPSYSYLIAPPPFVANTWFFLNPAGINPLNPITNPSAFFTPNDISVVAFGSDQYGCRKTITINFDLLDPNRLNDTTIYKCLGQASFDLPTILNGINVSWSGNQVNGYTFDMTGLSPGMYDMTVSPINAFCVNPALVQVIISPIFPIPLDQFKVCSEAEPFVLYNPAAGGTFGEWVGSPYITNNVFDVVNSGPGIFNITFVPDLPSCLSTNTTIISVTLRQNLPPISFDSVCQNGPLVPLPTLIEGFTGDWQGISVKNNQFDPKTAPGDYELTFTVQDTCVKGFKTTIRVKPEQKLKDLPNVLLCKQDSIILLPSEIENVSGDWVWNGNTTTVFDMTDLIEGIYTLTFIPTPGECSNIIKQQYIIGDLNAGEDVLKSLCEPTNTINLQNQLQVNVITGGQWYNDQDKKISANVVPSNLKIGINKFYYVISNPFCGVDTAFLILDIIKKSNAGIDNNLTICNNKTNINFSDLLNNFDTSGVWQQDNNLILDLENLSSISINKPKGGNYIYKYIIPSNVCPPDTATINLNIVEYNDAGADLTTELCSGETIILNNLLTSNTNPGTFYNPNNIPGFTSTSLNTVGLPQGPYTFYHIQNNQSPCFSDTARITVQLSETVSAGNDVIADICVATQINLFSILDPETSLGGTFYNGGVEVVNGNFSIQNIIGNEPQFIYVVGDGLLCPFDTSLINLKITRLAISSLEIDPFICFQSSTDLILSHGLESGAILYFSVTPEQGGKFLFQKTIQQASPLSINISNELNLANSILLIAGNTYFIKLDSISFNGCSQLIDLQVKITTLQSIPSLENYTVCEGKSLTIRGITLDQQKTNHTFTFTDSNGCDSVIYVSIQFIKPPQDQTFVVNTCDPQFSLSFNGQVFNKSNPSGTVVFTDDIKCDSTIFVNITYNDASSSNLTRTVCNPLYSLNVGGTIFNAQKPSGQVKLIGANQYGCDSIVNVQLYFENFSLNEVNINTCNDAFSIVVGSQIFDKNNTSGQVTIPQGSVFGCDSIINVSLKFLPVTIENLTFSTCDSAFTVDVNNTLFSSLLPVGQVILPSASINNCDSIVNVAILYKNPSRNNYIYETCDPSFSVQIGQGVFDINNTSGRMVLANASANGCDSIIDVKLTISPLSITYETVESCYEDSSSLVIKSATLSGPFDVLNNDDFDKLNKSDTTYISKNISQLILATESGCIDTIMLNHPDFTPNTADIVATEIDKNTYSLTLSQDASTKDIKWISNGKISCDTCRVTTITIANDELVTVDIFYGNECITTRELELKYKAPDKVITLPNIISPNGSNNYFYVTLPEGMNAAINSMSIYDRWGNLVFYKINPTPNNKEDGWNGTHLNQNVIPGVYVYFIELKIEGNEKSNLFKGDVTVIK
jgi:hypothetical protein